MQVEARVYQGKAERQTVLDQLGLTEAFITEIVKTANAEAGRVSAEDHAKNSRGIIRYHWMVFGLRFFRPKGWKGASAEGFQPSGTKRDRLQLVSHRAIRTPETWTFLPAARTQKAWKLSGSSSRIGSS